MTTNSTENLPCGDETGEPAWSRDDMIAASIEHWALGGIDPADCAVIKSRDGDDRPCLIVVHRPTGRTSDEAGDAGRWHLDGRSY